MYMEIELKQKEEKSPIVDRISFPSTKEQRLAIEELKETTNFKINEAYRDFTDYLINKIKSESKAG